MLKPMLNNCHVNPQRGPRVVSSTGARNLERAKGTLSMSTADYSHVGRERRPPSRLLGAEAEAAAQRNAGTMASVLNAGDNRGYMSPTRPQRRPQSAASNGSSADTTGVGGERRAAGGVSYVVEFPGGPSCPPPRPPRRSGAVAEAAAQRNAGTLASVLNTDENRDYQDPRPQPKLRSTEAKENAARFSGSSTACCLNYDRNRGYSSARPPCVRGAVAQEAMERSRGVTGGVLAVGDNVDHSPPQPVPRRTGVEAEMYAQRATGAAIRRTLDVDSNVGYQTARPVSRTVTKEARDNADRNKGQGFSQLIGNDANSEESALRLEPRVKPEARDIAMKSRGSCGLALEGQPAPDPVLDARVKSDGRENYERGRQGSMNQVLSGSEYPPERPQSRVKYEGTEISQNGHTGTVHKLFNSYGQLPQSARPVARVRPEAEQNAIRNKGTMSDFL